MLENGSVLAGWHTGASCISNPADLSRVASQYHAPTNTHTHTTTHCVHCATAGPLALTERVDLLARLLFACLGPGQTRRSIWHGTTNGQVRRAAMWGACTQARAQESAQRRLGVGTQQSKGHTSQQRRWAASQNAQGIPRHARVGRAFLQARQPKSTYIIIMPRSSASCCSASLKLTCSAPAAVTMPHTNKTRRMRQSETAGTCSL